MANDNGQTTLEPISLSLYPRGPSIQIHGRASESDDQDGVEKEKVNSLDGTRRFYNVHSQGHSPGSSTNRMSTTRVTPIKASSSASISNPDPHHHSSFTSSSRPSSITPSETPTSHSAQSPTTRYSGLPVPMPKGFLSPQKPAAAMRMEQKERAASAGRQSLSLEPNTGTANIDSSKMSNNSTYRSGSVIFVSKDHGNEVGEEESTHEREATSSYQPLHSPFSDERQEERSSVDYSNIPPPPEARRLSRGAGGTIGSIFTDDSSLRRHPQPETDSFDPLVDFNAIVEKGPTSHSHFPDHSTKTKATNITTENKKSQPLFPTSSASASQVTNRKNVEGGTRKYKYLVMNTSTRFFFNGHAVTGGDSPLSFIISIVVLLGITGVWVGTTGAWLWVHGTEYGMTQGGGIAVVVVFLYLFGLTITSLCAAAFRDPGILPRNLDVDPPYSQVESWWEAVPRELRVGEGRVTVKYCETCKIYRPPRCSHCRVCGNCVDGIDHHCSYLHTCIGKRNYLPFLVFVIFVAISDMYVVIFSAVHFAMICHHDSVSFGTALKDSPGAAVSFLLGIASLGPVLFLLQYHLRLLVWNLTTIEKIRASASKNLFKANKRPENPFTDASLLVNILRASLGRPQIPSWIDPSGWHVPDKRKVNPALTSPEKYIRLV